MPLPQELHKALPTRLGDSALRPTEEAGEGLQSFVAHAQSLSENAGTTDPERATAAAKDPSSAPCHAAHLTPPAPTPPASPPTARL